MVMGEGMQDWGAPLVASCGRARGVMSGRPGGLAFGWAPAERTWPAIWRKAWLTLGVAVASVAMGMPAVAAEPLFDPSSANPPVRTGAPAAPRKGELSEQARQRLAEQGSASVAPMGTAGGAAAPAGASRLVREGGVGGVVPVSTARQVAPNHLEPLWGEDAVPAPTPAARRVASPKAVARGPRAVLPQSTATFHVKPGVRSRVRPTADGTVATRRSGVVQRLAECAPPSAKRATCPPASGATKDTTHAKAKGAGLRAGPRPAAQAARPHAGQSPRRANAAAARSRPAVASRSTRTPQAVRQGVRATATGKVTPQKATPQKMAKKTATGKEKAPGVKPPARAPRAHVAHPGRVVQS